MPKSPRKLQTNNENLEVIASLAACVPGGAYGPELDLWDSGEQVVIGVDEAGRGPLAGPVVTAAVAFKSDVVIDGIGDSKILAEEKREELDLLIRKNALAYSVTLSDPLVIDKVNILEATRRSMLDSAKQVATRLKSKDPVLLVDGIIPPLFFGRQHNLIKGDLLSFSIGAASILAKVYRDRLMCDYEREYPGFGFDRHKGYGTPEHRRLLFELGRCPIHRNTFHIQNDNGDRTPIHTLPEWKSNG